MPNANETVRKASIRLIRLLLMLLKLMLGFGSGDRRFIGRGRCRAPSSAARRHHLAFPPRRHLKIRSNFIAIWQHGTESFTKTISSKE